MKPKIGVLDSGRGALSVIKELLKRNIKCDFLYFADYKNLPYGTKSKEESY